MASGLSRLLIEIIVPIGPRAVTDRDEIVQERENSNTDTERDDAIDVGREREHEEIGEHIERGIVTEGSEPL